MNTLGCPVEQCAYDIDTSLFWKSFEEEGIPTMPTSDPSQLMLPVRPLLPSCKIRSSHPQAGKTQLQFCGEGGRPFVRIRWACWRCGSFSASSSLGEKKQVGLEVENAIPPRLLQAGAA